MRIIKVILGVLLAVGGIYCMFTPIATYSVLAWLIGLAMIVEGVGGIITWIDRRNNGLANGWTLAGGIVSLLLGMILVGSYVLQFAMDAFIAYFIAIWLVIAGITRVAAAIAVRSQNPEGASGWIVQVVLGVLIAILGVMCIFNPLSVVAGVGMMLGISIVFVGIDLAVSAFIE